MNRIAKVLSQISDDMLMHYGVARRSGRYPWGSGDIHYGDSSLLPHAPVERRKNDMCPWRH